MVFVGGPEAPVEASVDLMYSMGFLGFEDWATLSVLVELESLSMVNLAG